MILYKYTIKLLFMIFTKQYISRCDKKGLICAIINIRNTFLKYSIYYISRTHGADCLYFSTNLQSFKTIQWMETSMDSQLKSLPFQIHSLFYKAVNTTSIPIGMEGMGSHEVVGPSNSNGQMASIQAFSCSTHHEMQLHQCPVSLASFVVIPCWLSAQPGKLEPLTDRPSIHGCQTGP